MGRGKIPIKKIENLNSRQVTFTKRKKGLFKKARDLSVLCDVHVAVVVFSVTGRVYDFSTTSNTKVLLDHYNRAREETQLLNPTAEAKLWKVEVESLRNELEDLQRTHRQLMGEDLAELGIQHLENLENQLQMSVKALRARKEQILKERLQMLNQQEILIHQENVELHRKLIAMQQEMTQLKKEENGRNTGGAKSDLTIDENNDPYAPILQLSLQTMVLQK